MHRSGFLSHENIHATMQGMAGTGVLKVPVKAIENFDEEAAFFNIQNNYEGPNPKASSVSVTNYQCHFNPLDKVVELYERTNGY